MKFISNIPFPEDCDELKDLFSKSVVNKMTLYFNIERKPIFLLVEVKYMLNLLFRCEEESFESILTFGETIFETAKIIKNNCQTTDKERSEVRSLCFRDNAGIENFDKMDAAICKQNGCELYQDVIHNTWAIYIDNVMLHCFKSEKIARRVFEYISRDIRQSSDKWMSVIEGNLCRF